jgi:pyruvate dehydrogenase E1 component alpha subunit
MLLESLNLAVAWSLPLLFVCKDNGWAVTTRSAQVTGGDLEQRAAAFGMPAESVDGLEVEAVADAAARAVDRARQRPGPSFIRARCTRADGHFLGDPMIRTAQRPIAEGGELFGKVVKAVVSTKGGGLAARAGSVAGMLDGLRRARQDGREGRRDPLERLRRRLRRQREQLELIDRQVAEEIAGAVSGATEEADR